MVIIIIAMISQGQIQSFLSHANGKVIFASSDIKKQIKRLLKTSLEVLLDDVFFSQSNFTREEVVHV